MTPTVKHLLSGLALILGVIALVWPNGYLTSVAVVLLSIAMFIP